MDLWQALILGVVEGLTEYLPVSSTGHLLVAQRLMGIPAGEAASAYAIVIQAGAILAVLLLYRARVGQMIRGLTGGDAAGGRLVIALIVAFLPAAVLGLATDDWIEQRLFGPWPVVGAWFVGGLVLLAYRGPSRPDEGRGVEAITWRTALVIGLAQALALWPGVSRSLATILGGLGAGLSMAASVEFSFLLGLLTLSAATAYKALGSGSAILGAYGVMAPVVGFVVAALSAAMAVRWMVAWLSGHSLAIFGWWRVGIACAVAGMLLAGYL
ncbi:MAG: undecaprenyl-diphosphate phosphatase [Vicinamibacterales bacterium]